MCIKTANKIHQPPFSGAKKVSVSTKFWTILSFSAVLILSFVGVYIGSNSVFFKLGAGENHNRKQKATQVFLAAGIYFVIGLYNGLKWTDVCIFLSAK